MDEIGPCIFVIDDDASVRQGLARLLRSGGYAVETFSSATAYLQDEPYDGHGCLILDLRMPELNGIDLQSSLIEKGYELPIIFLSGHGDVPVSVRAMKQGAVDFLTKPVDEAVLFAAVERALSVHESIRTRKKIDAGLNEKLRRLTPREIQVMRLLLSGARNKAIGIELGIAEKTVKAHRRKIMEKLNLSSATELGHFGALAGIEPERVE
jgi:FixJ family two-component response regulator